MRDHPIVPVDRIEADFLAALDRLDRGEPKHDANRKAVARGRLKVTFLSLANEAGHSRSHICYELNCRYPRIRHIVLQRRDERKGVRQVPARSAVGAVREQKRELELELAACRQKMLETIVEAEAARKEFKRVHERDQRELTHLRKTIATLQKWPGGEGLAGVDT